jgi:SNF family Na+-dependent transporter
MGEMPVGHNLHEHKSGLEQLPHHAQGFLTNHSQFRQNAKLHYTQQLILIVLMATFISLTVILSLLYGEEQMAYSALPKSDTVLLFLIMLIPSFMCVVMLDSFQCFYSKDNKKAADAISSIDQQNGQLFYYLTTATAEMLASLNNMQSPDITTYINKVKEQNRLLSTAEAFYLYRNHH